MSCVFSYSCHLDLKKNKIKRYEAEESQVEGGGDQWESERGDRGYL
jgi:hypothetical protein